MPRSMGRRDWWEVGALSIMHARSHQPTSYGQMGGFVNGFAVTLSLTPTRRRTLVNGNLVFDGCAPPGAIRVQRPGEQVKADLLTAFEQVTIFIPTSTFRSILREQGRPDDVHLDLVDPLWRADAMVDATLRCALKALRNKSRAGYHYVNTLGRALAAHLLYQYSAGATSSATLENLAAPDIRRAVQFIEDNMDRNLSLAEMALAAGLSTDRFRRDFKNIHQQSPHQYLIQRRVNRACELIAANRRPKFADIALKCGFADQSHLSTTFRRVLGASPTSFVR